MSACPSPSQLVEQGGERELVRPLWSSRCGHHAKQGKDGVYACLIGTIGVKRKLCGKLNVFSLFRGIVSLLHFLIMKQLRRYITMFFFHIISIYYVYSEWECDILIRVLCILCSLYHA